MEEQNYNMIDDRLNNMETPDQKLERQHEQQNRPIQKAVRADVMKSRVRESVRKDIDTKKKQAAEHTRKQPEKGKMAKRMRQEIER